MSMNEMKKNAIILGIIGGVCGLIICFIMSMITGTDGEETVSTGTRIFYYIISFLHGAICMGTAVVYSIEEWGVARCTVTHFLITLTSFYLLGTLQKWLVFFSIAFWIITASFVVAYFIIWLIFFVRYKRAIREMNEDLEKLRESDKKTNKK